MADPVCPIELESDVVLRDGSTASRGLLQSRRPRRRAGFRFWAQSVDIRGAAAAALDQDYVHHLTLLAFSGGGEGKVGGAQYVAIDEHRAEVGFSVADKLQGRGLWSVLLAEVMFAKRPTKTRWSGQRSPLTRSDTGSSGPR